MFVSVYIQTHGIFKRKRQISAGKQTHTCQFTIPELKIVFVLLYWLILTVLIWGAFSIRDGRDDIFDYHLRNYVDCMAGGIRKDHDCRELRLDLEAETYPVVEVIYLTIFAFLNFSSLSFVIQFETVRHTLRQATQKFSSKTLT